MKIVSAQQIADHAGRTTKATLAGLKAAGYDTKPAPGVRGARFTLTQANRFLAKQWPNVKPMQEDDVGTTDGIQQEAPPKPADKLEAADKPEPAPGPRDTPRPVAPPPEAEKPAPLQPPVGHRLGCVCSFNRVPDRANPATVCTAEISPHRSVT